LSEKVFEIFTDGGASGNPGPAGIGVVIREGGQLVAEISESIGDATNNVAEYRAAIAALEESIRRGATKVFINTDSELMYFQLTGSYKVKNEALRLLVDQVRQLSKKIKTVEIKCVRRELNTDADRLAKQAIERSKKSGKQSVHQAKVVASKSIFGEESPGSTG
jgi:ribonuclease HI